MTVQNLMKQRSAALIVSIVFLGACNPANSQRTDEDIPPPVSAEIDESSDTWTEISNSRQTAITKAVSAATPAVVSINVVGVERVAVRDPFLDDPFFQQFFGRRRAREYLRQVKALGSGFVISPDGYIATNNHVVRNATEITVSFQNGKTVEASIIGRDEATDLALLKVEPSDPLPYLSFTEDQEPLVGEWAIALGNPFGLFATTEPTVTVGVVSA
ncbi:MAG: 2-alkenal reductase, partial [Rhodothermales bacterium]|nr:2-alkenal reductase [Rhodothermales bacterium]